MDSYGDEQELKIEFYNYTQNVRIGEFCRLAFKLCGYIRNCERRENPLESKFRTWKLTRKSFFFFCSCSLDIKLVAQYFIRLETQLKEQVETKPVYFNRPEIRKEWNKLFVIAAKLVTDTELTED